jgi:hypothetical protein
LTNHGVAFSCLHFVCVCVIMHVVMTEKFSYMFGVEALHLIIGRTVTHAFLLDSNIIEILFKSFCLAK